MDAASSPVAPSAVRLPTIYRERHYRVLVLVAAFFFVAPVRYGSEIDLLIFSNWVTLAILGASFYLVFGVSGIFAFSHTAFYALGAYVSVWAARGQDFFGLWEWPRGFTAGFVAAVLIGAIVGLGFMAIVARAAHFYFAIGTIAFSTIALTVVTKWESFSAPGGEITTGIPEPSLFGYEFDTTYKQYMLLVALLLVVMLLIVWVERSPLKRDAVANRDNPLVAATKGVATVRINFVMFAAASAMAAAVGSLFVHRVGSLAPDSFPATLSLDLFIIVLLGGIDSPWGALLGSAFIIWFEEWFESLSRYQTLIKGLLILAIIAYLPDGLAGGWRKFERWSSRRRGGGDVATRPSGPGLGHRLERALEGMPKTDSNAGPA